LIISQMNTRALTSHPTDAIVLKHSSGSTTRRWTNRLPLLGAIACLLTAAPNQVRSAQNDPQTPVAALVGVLDQTGDPVFQRDILKGMTDAFQGVRQVPMPAGWEPVAARLGRSSNAEVRALTQSLSLTFGSQRALRELRTSLADASEPLSARRLALESLLRIRDAGLAPTLQELLASPDLRREALRALAAYDDPATPNSILAVYGGLSGTERREALNTLCSRVLFAKPLLKAVGDGTVPPRDLAADLIRQLRNLKNEELDTALVKVWGVARDSSEDKQKEIARYKQVFRAGGSTPGDAARGRGVFARTCAQCHTLFGTGGRVGPDLTGSNRGDLDYILQNMVDPNAVIPNEYRTSTVETKDDRVITGIIGRQDARSVTVSTAAEMMTLPRDEIAIIRSSEISMMPEGLLDNLKEQEVRDLIYYLSRPGQAPLIASADTLDLFFNRVDLTNWDATEGLWKVENGELVGLTATGLRQNDWIKSQMEFGDFRLVCSVKLQPNTGNSGIQFRSAVLPTGEVKGYQADVGAGWWGKLYEEHGRAILWDQSGEAAVKEGDWNVYEIVAVGNRILTAINGRRCVDLNDPEGAARGIIALQLHAGAGMEVRYKDFTLELNPQPTLKTLR
jgi:putative heme-binding domain-containing protein